MRKAAARHGDPTTTGGFVMAYSSTISDKGKTVALSGDEATCGNCNGAFEIIGTGKGISEKSRDVVLDGDRVLCPCGKNLVIVGSDSGIFIDTFDSLSESQYSDGLTATRLLPSALVYDEQIYADAIGALLFDYPYHIETADGRVESGRLDTSGKLPRIGSGSTAAEYTVYWGDEALARQVGVRD